MFKIPILRRWRKLVFRFGVLHPMGDDDLHPDLLVKRFHVVVAVAVMENADNSFLFPLGYAENAAFALAVGAYASELDQDLIAVHGIPDFRRRDEDIAQQLAARP